MSTIPGTFHNGHIVLDVPVDWPEGARVDVVPSHEGIGLTEETWPEDEDGRGKLAALMTSLEPVEMTAAEEAEWEAARAAVKEFTLKKMAEDTSMMP